MIVASLIGASLLDPGIALNPQLSFVARAAIALLCFFTSLAARENGFVL